MTQPEIESFASYLAKHLGFELSELQTKERPTRIAEPRQMIMSYMYSRAEDFDLSQARIGELFNRDHATVLNAIKVVRNFCETDVIFKSKYDKFKAYADASNYETEFMCKYSL